MTTEVLGYFLAGRVPKGVQPRARRWERIP